MPEPWRCDDTPWLMVELDDGVTVVVRLPSACGKTEQQLEPLLKALGSFPGGPCVTGGTGSGYR